MIFSLMRLHRQINRSRELSDHTDTMLRKQQQEEARIAKQFKAESDLTDLLLTNCKKARSAVTSALRTNYEETRKTVSENYSGVQISRVSHFGPVRGNHLRKSYRTRVKNLTMT